MERRTALDVVAQFMSLVSLKGQAVGILENMEKYEDLPEDMRECVVKAVECLDEASGHFDKIIPIVVAEHGEDILKGR